MLMTLTSDQEFFRETTVKFLEKHGSGTELRRRRDDPAGFDPEYWRRGAALGWTSLLVSEAKGGGTISDAGLVDLGLVAFEFGRHAAAGPLVSTNVVAATLSAVEEESHGDVLGALLSGDSIASWCFPDPAQDDYGRRSGVELRMEGSDVVVNGAARPVESAAQASHLLVSAQSDRGVTQALVPTAAAGVTVAPLHTVDLTRRFARVTFDGVRLPASALVGEIGRGGDDVTRQFHLALAILNAEAVGTMQAGFDMTVQWAFDRYSFGRPLASYQALKHRFADMTAWLEASHAVSDGACAAVAAGTPDADELTSAAKAFIGEYGLELLQDCVQMHGGIGLTFEHDLHLFLRRLTVDRSWLGTPADHRQRVATMVGRREPVP